MAPLGAEPPGHVSVGQSREILLALLDDLHGEDSDVRAHDAAAHRLALALALPAGAVAAVALGQQNADAALDQHTLLHGETVLVVAAGNLEHVALEVVAERVSVDLLAHALVEEDGAGESFREAGGGLTISCRRRFPRSSGHRSLGMRD